MRVMSATLDECKPGGERGPCRRRLQMQFDQCQAPAPTQGKRFSLETTRRCLRRISTTFSSVRGLLSQRFKGRPQTTDDGPGATPYTPTKLYSPFGIDSPYKGPKMDPVAERPVEAAQEAPQSCEEPDKPKSRQRREALTVQENKDVGPDGSPMEPF